MSLGKTVKARPAIRFPKATFERESKYLLARFNNGTSLLSHTLIDRSCPTKDLLPCRYLSTTSPGWYALVIGTTISDFLRAGNSRTLQSRFDFNAHSSPVPYTTPAIASWTAS
jgi:hypothetical protein